jgi:hypothetical protein
MMMPTADTGGQADHDLPMEFQFHHIFPVITKTCQISSAR